MSLYYNEDLQEHKVFNIILTIGIIITLLIGLSMAFGPSYRVYKLERNGYAKLKEAEWEKKISIEEAKADAESAKYKAERQVEIAEAEAQVEITRARGVAEANTIIADSLKGNESYLRYLWIDKVADNNNLIYVPTEANLPILEANRR